MIQKLSIFAFVIGGIFLIGKGISEWNKQSEVRVTVDQFAEALIEGDRSLFLSSLHEDLKEYFLNNEDQSDFIPLPDAKHRIQFVRFQDDRAISQLMINGDGYVIKPSMTLKRDKNSVWKIIELDQTQNKPLRPDYEDDNEVEVENVTKKDHKSLRSQFKEKVDKQKKKKAAELEMKKKASTL